MIIALLPATDPFGAVRQTERFAYTQPPMNSVAFSFGVLRSSSATRPGHALGGPKVSKSCACDGDQPLGERMRSERDLAAFSA